MQQSDGSDLPGISASHSADIGIIHVDPTDDRQGVLAAILTQDKLNRKQVVVVLPEQGKVFQRAVDFEGLKNMRRGLKAQLVFIAPSGPGPAEFARQRRFPVYSSLDNYAKSLQDAADRSTKRGWFSLPGQKPASSTPVTRSEQAKQTSPASNNIVNDQHAHRGTDAIAAGAVGAAAVIGIEALAARDSSSHAPSSLQGATTPAKQRAHSFLSDDVPTQPNREAPLNGSVSSLADPSSRTIVPPRARSGNSGKIPTSAAQPTANSTTKQRNWRNIAAVGVVGAAVGAVGARFIAPARTSLLSLNGGARTNPLLTSTMGHVTRASTARAGGGPPPQGATGGRGGGSASPPPGRGRTVLIALAVLLAALLVAGGVSLALPGGGPLGPLVPGAAPSATVTITPASIDLKNTYVIFGVTGTPAPSQRQVQARQLTFTSSSQSKTVNATGVKQTTGTQATGSLTFFNGSPSVQTIASGTRLTGSDGAVVITNELAVIPAVNPPTEGSVTISGHAAAVGTSGNIRALDINGTCCIAGNSVIVRNSQFGGGIDPQNYTFVQQSDIDGAAKPLENTLTPSAQQSLQSQVRANEKFVSSPQCTPNVTSDHAAGDRNVTNVTVTVKVSCAGEVYDQQGTKMITTDLLKQEAAKNPGPSYALTGNLVTTITQITVTDPNKGTLSLLAKAEGVWVYQFSDSQKQMLAQLIAGKSLQDAQSLLMKQPGIAKADIQLSGGDGKTLPAANQITIVVQSVPGAQGPPTTPTTGPGVPIATPSVGLG